MGPFNLKVTKTEITRYVPNDPTIKTTYKYTTKGNVINCETSSGYKTTMTVTQLTENRFVWHQDSYEDGVNYTLDIVHTR